MGEQWVEDDGTLVGPPDEEHHSLPADYDGETQDVEHARDLEEAGRVAGLDLRAHDTPLEPPDIDHDPSPETMLGNVLDAVMGAVREVMIPVIRELHAMSERVDLLEGAVFDEYRDRELPLDTPDIGTVDRPLTPAEDQARAQAIAAEARREADRLRDEDLRGIDQAAPDAPPAPVEDEVVIPVVGPRPGFR